MSDAGLDIAKKAAGGQIVRTEVKTNWLIEEMLCSGYYFGGKTSGHLIFRDSASTDNGVVMMLQILSIMKKLKSTLSVLARVGPWLPQLVTNLKVRI
jgi:phosphoglucosamine mutase